MGELEKNEPLPEKGLTKAEEQVMQAVWARQKAFLKDIVDVMPPPQPHPNTIATILKILVDKGYVQASPMGRNNLYSALVSKEAYSRQSLGNLVSNYFNGSFSHAVSFLVDQKQLSVGDLELLLQELKKK